MTEQQHSDFINKFVEYTGQNLEDLLRNLQPLSMTEAAFINRVEDIIRTEIRRRNPSFADRTPTEYEQGVILKAMLEQAVYMANAGDFSLVTGYDPVTNSAVDLRELRRRRFSPLAKDTLSSAGLFYSGIRHGTLSYFEKRSYLQ